MTFSHIMLDLETLSSQRDAMIVSIGAVRFDLDNFTVAERGSDDEFYMIVNLEEKEGYSLRIDTATVKWWMQQDERARAVFKEQGDKLTTVLSEFNRFVRNNNLPHEAAENTLIWGNGATFDNVILRHAYEACGMAYPVGYRNDMCYRTVRKMFAHLNIYTPDGPAGVILHNALDDARNQAAKLVRIFQILSQQNTK